MAAAGAVGIRKKLINLHSNILIMQNISGIQFNNDSTGVVKQVTIDLQQHGNELQNFFEKVGASELDNNFEAKWEKGITGDELVKRVELHLKTLPWKISYLS